MHIETGGQSPDREGLLRRIEEVLGSAIQEKRTGYGRRRSDGWLEVFGLRVRAVGREEAPARASNQGCFAAAPGRMNSKASKIARFPVNPAQFFAQMRSYFDQELSVSAKPRVPA